MDNQRIAAIARGLDGHVAERDATVDDYVKTALATLITRKGHSLTGLARSMRRSHTWLLRKLAPNQGSPRSTTLGDVADVLAHLGATVEDLVEAGCGS